MTKYRYTQVSFKTPRARVEYAEACVELAAEEASRVYEGLRVDANDGELALWSQDDLVVALHRLGDELAELEKARNAEREAKASS